MTVVAPCRRLAIWSGPRNLSTALMRSFSSRSDCVVSDEPFYAAYLQRDPAGTLARLCAALAIPWDPAMLHWPAGPHPQDGVWAPHWYAGTWASTGFVPDRDAPEPPPADVDFLDAALALYDRLTSCSSAAIPPTTRSS